MDCTTAKEGLGMAAWIVLPAGESLLAENQRMGERVASFRAAFRCAVFFCWPGVVCKRYGVTFSLPPAIT